LEKKLSKIKARFAAYCNLVRKHPYSQYQRECLLWELEGLLNHGESLKDDSKTVYGMAL